jgi:hypothetical protein
MNEMELNCLIKAMYCGVLSGCPVDVEEEVVQE